MRALDRSALALSRSIRRVVSRVSGFAMLLATTLLVCAAPVLAQDTFTLSGFAKLQGKSADDGFRYAEELSAQLQLGLDWNPSPLFHAHVHVIGRSDDGDSRNGDLGVTEAWIEFRQSVGQTLFRVRGGAMFLPTSMENVDPLWENPYAISSSALNSWFGEELRPIGVDVEIARGRVTLGGTVFRGNDTLGALPPVRGWDLHDYWILLGEKIPVDDTFFTSVSAETDGRLGYAWRALWRGDRLLVEVSHFDNRSDALPYGDLYNWNTRFTVVGIEHIRGNWTLASEYGYGPTVIVAGGRAFAFDLRAAYLLLSRSLSRGRLTVRIDEFDNGTLEERTLTLAGFRRLGGDVSAGLELVTTGDDNRVILQIRYGFAL